MAIRFRCTYCNQRISIATRMAGRAVQCPKCNQEITVPATETEEEDSGLQLRKASTEFDEMDLTPMVDVTFLLLIFFMITASFSLQKSLEIPRPDPDKDGATQSLQTLDDLEENSIIVQIDDRNAISVDYEPLSNPDDLVDVMETRRRDEQKFEVVIEADSQSLHETVVKVIDAANEIGMQKIRIATTAVKE